MLESRPPKENTQMSVVATPLAGRCNTTGFPARKHELLATENAPSAPTLKSRSSPGTETPAVVGSTTTMSFALAAGAALVSEITSSAVFCAATTRETLLEVVPSGLRICTATLPTAATSAGVTGTVHSDTDVQVVVRAVPPISKTEPGPGLDATKLPPSTRNVKPLAPPAYTLAGCRAKILAPVAMVTLAVPDC